MKNEQKRGQIAIIPVSVANGDRTLSHVKFLQNVFTHVVELTNNARFLSTFQNGDRQTITRSHSTTADEPGLRERCMEDHNEHERRKVPNIPISVTNGDRKLSHVKFPHHVFNMLWSL